MSITKGATSAATLVGGKFVGVPVAVDLIKRPAYGKKIVSSQRGIGDSTTMICA